MAYIDGDPGTGRGIPLTPREAGAARAFIRRVRREVPAELVQASLFGSRARGESRADSDLDILLVFLWLTDDREPQATQAEAVAEQIASVSGVPLTTWAVSLRDLRRGIRTPMLIDALADSIPLWSANGILPRLPFTAEDALWCAERLLTRVYEGGYQLADHLRTGDSEAAARRGRDDVVRLCTAILLLHGITRPRRGHAVRAALPMLRLPEEVERVLRWAASSFGADGRDDDAAVAPPPGGLPALRLAVETLRAHVRELEARLRRRLEEPIG